MKKRLLVLFMAILLGVIAIPTATNAASHKVIPSAFRGTWYDYSGHGKYGWVKFTRTTANIGIVISRSGHGYHKLYVQKHIHDKGMPRYGRSVYTFNRAMDDAHSSGFFWIGKRKINGRYHRVLKSYRNMGYFTVLTKTKIPHDYSYEYKGKDWAHEIGR